MRNLLAGTLRERYEPLRRAFECSVTRVECAGWLRWGGEWAGRESAGRAASRPDEQRANQARAWRPRRSRLRRRSAMSGMRSRWPRSWRRRPGDDRRSG